MTCEHAKETKLLKHIRVCRLDHVACTNYDKPKLVKKCPTLQAFNRGEPVGKTPNLDYSGVPKAFRKGKFGTFNGGMPPQYLMGNIRAKKRQQK